MKNFSYTSPTLHIGYLPVGGDNPIRLQSMTNTDTLDAKASVAQCIRIIEAGADLVRLTAQGVREAENLAVIKKELRNAGFDTPLVADIHFNPAAAETAARLVEKVRINPGNYTDKRASFKTEELTEKEYSEELERIHARLLPLIKICREHGTVIRIGINHGSLSDRIMTRYGNTPLGMVESALEFIRIFRSEHFNNLVLSMKSSDTDVMIRSNRMLTDALVKEGVAYPIHLGVTEAGEGEDGRIRSAAGIGALLKEGIGDTIRVSLSEDPEFEIPVARKLADFFPREASKRDSDHKPYYKDYTVPENPPEVFRNVNGPLVFADLRSVKEFNDAVWIKAGFRKDKNEMFIRTDSSPDLVLTDRIPDNPPAGTKIAIPYHLWIENPGKPDIFPVFSRITEFPAAFDKLNIVENNPSQLSISPLQGGPGGAVTNSVILFTYQAGSEDDEPYRLMNELSENRSVRHIILNPVFKETDYEDLQLKAAGSLGAFLTDRNISGIMISNADPDHDLTGLAFSILQCTEKRITRTMYISCPTCGRTKFNLQETVKKVKEATGHLKGLKIAVMGCIVNGPGEMAGADYGYVGAAPGKVHIYKGMNPVLKNVAEEEAISELLRVIKESD